MEMSGCRNRIERKGDALKKRQMERERGEGWRQRMRRQSMMKSWEACRQSPIATVVR